MRIIGPSAFQDLVSGRKRGLAASLARGVLRLAEFPYTAAVRRRNRRFDSGRKASERVDTTVVSVGNLTLGGTGKTPLVEWLARWFLARGESVVIVSRGYGAERGALNDEALELAQRLPNVPHLQNPDRVAAARAACRLHAPRAIVLDDGFQHRRLARDLDLVLIDALAPFGHGHVFPRGALREPIEGLARAQIVAISRANLVTEDGLGRIRSEIRSHAPGAAIVELAHAPRYLLDAKGGTEPLARYQGRRVAAFCGIGAPEGFRRALEQCGYGVSLFREFPDHHAYRAVELDRLADDARRLECEALICTCKDLVKIGVNEASGVPLYALSIGLEILSGASLLENALADLPRPNPTASVV